MAIEEVARNAIAALKRARVPHMLVGGVAVSYYGLPRATIDIDIVLALESKAAVDRFIAALKSSGLKISRPEVETAVDVGDRFVASRGGQRVDFWLAKTEYNKKTLKRRRAARIFGTRVWICSPEDLIISKLHVGRARDYEDVIGILHRQKGKLQMKYLVRQAEGLRLDRRLKKLLKEVET